MAFGDWSSEKNFRRYVGVTGLCARSRATAQWPHQHQSLWISGSHRHLHPSSTIGRAWTPRPLPWSWRGSPADGTRPRHWDRVIPGPRGADAPLIQRHGAYSAGQRNPGMNLCARNVFDAFRKRSDCRCRDSPWYILRRGVDMSCAPTSQCWCARLSLLDQHSWPKHVSVFANWAPFCRAGIC